MNFIKILGGIGAGLLAGAGLIVAGKTGLGKSDEPAADEEAKAPADAETTADETAEETKKTEETPDEES